MKLVTLLFPLILTGCLQGCYLGCTNGVDLIFISEKLKGNARQLVLQHEDCHITLRHKWSSRKQINELEADTCAAERTGLDICKVAKMLNNQGHYRAAKAMIRRNNCEV